MKLGIRGTLVAVCAISTVTFLSMKLIRKYKSRYYIDNAEKRVAH
jgi:hypothetical protein